MMIYVKPANGARIRQPERRFKVMPEAGAFVDANNTHYARLLVTKDIVKAEPQKVEKKATVVVEKPSKKNTESKSG